MSAPHWSDTPLRALEASALAFFVGANAGFAFIEAPIAFHVIEDPDAFATLVEQTLGSLAKYSKITGAVALAAATLRAFRADEPPLELVRAMSIALAISAVEFQDREIVPSMIAAQRAMGGSFRNVAHDDPHRLDYQRRHKQSTRVYGGALLIAAGAFLHAVTRPR